MKYVAPECMYPSAEMENRGDHLIDAGKVGCIILAGGMGSRWGKGMAKGAIPMDIFDGETLFDVLCARVKKRAKRAKRALFLAVMTSDATDAATRAYFPNKNIDGVELSFLTQPSLPFLDDEKKEIEGSSGPSGNGEVFSTFCNSGLWQMWQDRGIEYVHIIAVDNVLADPFDPYACGVLELQHVDLAVKSVIKESPEQLLGVLVREGEQVFVMEYSELPEGVDFVGFPAYIGLICVSMQFIQRVSTYEFPYHLARKKWGNALAWKRERFIFDCFGCAQGVCVLLYPPEKVYAPLKDKGDVAAARRGFLSVKDCL